MRLYQPEADKAGGSLVSALWPAVSLRDEVSAAIERGLLATDAVERLEVAQRLLPQLVGSVNGLLVLVAGCPSRRRGVCRDVSVALMVRIANLFDSLLALGPRYASALILLRCLTESTIDLVYLEEAENRSQVARRFKQASLYEDRLILVALDRYEPPLDGTKRMMGSLLGEAARNLSSVRLAHKDDRTWSDDASVEARAAASLARISTTTSTVRCPAASTAGGPPLRRWAYAPREGRSPRLDAGRIHVGFAVTACWIALQAADAYVRLAGTAAASPLRAPVSELIGLAEDLDRLASGNDQARRPLETGH